MYTRKGRSKDDADGIRAVKSPSASHKCNMTRSTPLTPLGRGCASTSSCTLIGSAVPAAPAAGCFVHTHEAGMSKQVPWDVIPENTGVVLPEQLVQARNRQHGGDGERGGKYMIKGTFKCSSRRLRRGCCTLRIS